MVEASVFDQFLNKTNFFLKLIGMYIDNEDSQRTIAERLWHHWRFMIHIIALNISIVGEFIQLIIGLATGQRLIEITYLLPCLTLCMLGNYKIYYFILNIHHANDIISKLKKLEPKIKQSEDVGRKIRFLKTMRYILLGLEVVGVTAFAVGPLAITASLYYKRNELKFFLPFMVWYPFDACDIKFWPFVYVHQMWSAWVAVLSVYGPDSFFLTCCTFIHIQFISLQNDWKNIVISDSYRGLSRNETVKEKCIVLVDRHRELIRCVELLEEIYTKSTLFNVLTSSLIICATGFNLMALEDFALIAPFIAFIIFGLLQIFCYCYYGDCIMRSSLAVGDAIYSSKWIDCNVADKKYFSIVLTRTQKPCKLSAYGFTVINLRAFMRILSTSWSYFALLRQMYGQNQK